MTRVLRPDMPACFCKRGTWVGKKGFFPLSSYCVCLPTSFLTHGGYRFVSRNAVIPLYACQPSAQVKKTSEASAAPWRLLLVTITWPDGSASQRASVQASDLPRQAEHHPFPPAPLVAIEARDREHGFSSDLAKVPTPKPGCKGCS